MNSERDLEYSLRFENHQTILTETLTDFRIKKSFVDVTLVCQGQEIEAHQTILAACSPLFEKLLKGRSQIHPVIIFNDVSKGEMMSLLEFIYRGRVNVSKTLLPALILAAKNLQIRGLGHELQDGMSPNSSSKHQFLGNASTPNRSKFVVRDQTMQRTPSIEKARMERTKVKNPFARTVRSYEDSDSTFCEEDIAKPGPSKLEVYSPPSHYDSDVEIIDNNPVLVINDTQPIVNNSPEWFRKTEPKNKRRGKGNDQKRTAISYSSDDSEISSSLPKKPKKALIQYSDEESMGEEEVRVNPIALKSKSNNQQSTSSALPAVLTVADTLTEDNDSIKNKKEQISIVPSKHSENLSLPFSELGSYCVVCKHFKKGHRLHVKKVHNLAPRNKFSCKVCCKSFFQEKFLQFHKCNPQF